MDIEMSSSTVLNINSFEVVDAPAVVSTPSTIPPASGVTVVEPPAATAPDTTEATETTDIVEVANGALASLPVLVTPVTPVAPVAVNDRADLSREELAEIALEEIGWYYSTPSGSKDPAVRQARRVIKALLDTLPKKRRAAISLTFSKRCPSKLLAKATTRSVRLIVQIYKKRHGGGVRQLERAVKCEGSEVLWYLEDRADRLFRAAMVLYRRARGNAPSLVPPTWRARLATGGVS
jgi:hypothetical protein